VRFDETPQRFRQCPGPAFWQRPSAVLLPWRAICQASRHRRVRRLGSQMGHEQHERAAMVVFESVVNHVPGRHRQPPLPLFSVGNLRQLIVQRFSETNGRE